MDEKVRRKNQIELIKIYCQEAIERWEKFPNNDNDPDTGLVNFSKEVDKCVDMTRKSDKPFTPFISSANSNSAAVRNAGLQREEIYGLFGDRKLSNKKLTAILKFMHDEQLANALADDLRSEYVHKELSQDRKAEIFRFYGAAVQSAYHNAKKVTELLKDA